MTNTTDITAMSDATLDAFVACKTAPGKTIPLDHLSHKEMRILFKALGVQVPASYFLSLDDQSETATTGPDHHDAILARQETECPSD